MGVNYQNEERRGIEAERLLVNPIYVEAYEAIERRIVDQLALAATTQGQADELRHLLVALRKVRQYMANVATSGTMAAQEINRQATLGERMRNQFRSRAA